MPDKIKTNRLFLALHLNSKVIAEKLSGLLEPLEDLSLKMTLVPVEKYHITLSFLGELHSEAINVIARGLPKALTGLRAQTITLDKIDYFPPTSETLLAAYVTLTAELTSLNQAISGFLKENNLVHDTRKFIPHISLARFREQYTTFQAISLNDCQFVADEVVLYKSELQPGRGHVYTALARSPLKS